MSEDVLDTIRSLRNYADTAKYAADVAASMSAVDAAYHRGRAEAYLVAADMLDKLLVPRPLYLHER